MPSKIPVAYIDLRVFVHATEETEKVLNAVHNILPALTIDSVLFRESNLTGYHGNPIVLFEARIKDRNINQAIIEKLASGLSVLDKEVLSGDMSQHLERGSLYLRFDKQAAYGNRFKFGSADPIHFCIHFEKSNPEEISQICRNYGLIP